MREERENESGIRDNMTFNGGTRDVIFRRERDLLNLITGMQHTFKIDGGMRKRKITSLQALRGELGLSPVGIEINN